MALLQSSSHFLTSNHSISPNNSNSNNNQIPKLKISKFVSLQYWIGKTDRIFRIKCTGQESIIRTTDGGGDGGNGKGGFNGGDDSDGDGDGDYDEKEFGPVVKFDEVVKEAEKRGANLPTGMLEAAKTTGLRRLILSRYLDMQGSAWPLGFLMRHCAMLRNRMLADPSFLFKVGTEFPLMSRCRRIDKILESAQGPHEGTFLTTLEDFPGGSDIFFVTVKFCYGVRVEFTPRNIVMIYCAADYLEMTEDYGEDNLLLKADAYFHKNVLRNWKDCILALQSCDSVIPRADKLEIISKCLHALSVMVCTDPSLFGWPMLMYGSLQSPGGSILWNGISTGARIQTIESDWWFEDISYLSVPLFQRLIQAMEARGIRHENLAGAMMYYCRKYLPGLGRWQSGQQGGKTRTVASFSMTTPASVDEKVLLESVVKQLPELKGKSFCRFLLGLLRVALILGVNHTCQDSLERRTGMQLDLASLDGLLIPSYSDSDTLYNTDCVERMIHHFISSEPGITATPDPSSFEIGTSPSSNPLRRVAKLVDSYIAEVASDVNLKPGKVRSLAEALPESSRSLHDGLYRALDIYFKAHPWLSDKEKEQLCNIIDFQKLSIDACAHASQNERLPLRVVLQVLFFEQLQLRTALAGCLNNLDTESAPAAPVTGAPSDMAGQIVQRDGWVTVVRENQGLKVDLERMKSRVGELEEEFSKIKQEMRKVTKSHSYLSSPRFLARRIGCKLLPQSSDTQPDVIESTGPSPRSSVEQPRNSRHRKSSSLF